MSPNAAGRQRRANKRIFHALLSEICGIVPTVIGWRKTKMDLLDQQVSWVAKSVVRTLFNLWVMFEVEFTKNPVSQLRPR